MMRTVVRRGLREEGRSGRRLEDIGAVQQQVHEESGIRFFFGFLYYIFLHWRGSPETIDQHELIRACTADYYPRSSIIKIPETLTFQTGIDARGTGGC